MFFWGGGGEGGGESRAPPNKGDAVWACLTDLSEHFAEAPQI